MAKKQSVSKPNKRAYKFSLDRIQFFFLISGSLLSLVLCFTLGLMLGYQLSGVSLREQLPSREEIAALVKKSQDISFYETLVEPSTKSTKDYTIQVAAFKNKRAAYKLRDELKGKGYPAYVSQSAEGENGRWFRVRLGTYATRPQAQAVAEQIKQQTKLKPFIVR